MSNPQAVGNISLDQPNILLFLYYNKYILWLNQPKLREISTWGLIDY